MFDSIQGRLETREPTRVVVVAGGLGYDIHVSLATYEALPPSGESVRLLLHPVVREDEWRLFGFAAPQEREAFRALLRVSGVGPVVALGLLSGLRPAELRDAVAGGDVATLKRVKGVGKKTAERIIVELRDAFAADLGGEEAGASGTGAAAGGDAVEQDAVRALVALGLDALEARRRIRKHRDEAADSVSDLVRAALRG